MGSIFLKKDKLEIEEFNINCTNNMVNFRINSWVYQLQDISPDQIARSLSDLAVIDYSSDGSESGAFAPQILTDMRSKPDGSRRILLGYMSIGEAESYRFYWHPEWLKTNRPDWLGSENPDWRGNYFVQYWELDWQNLIYGTPESYLDKIISAGFDGVYLDRVDAFQSWKKDYPNASKDMVEFVEHISTYAKLRNPNFIIVVQNGEELLEFTQYRQAIDVIAKEDLFFGIDGDGVANKNKDITSSLKFLRLAQKDNRPVLVVEYLSDETAKKTANQYFGTYGLIGTFAPRLLDDLDSGSFPENTTEIKMPRLGLCDS